MNIFDGNKKLKTAKIITLIFLGVLFVWFSFDMTGLKSGQTKIVTPAFPDTPEDFVFWLLFVGAIVVFVLKDGVGKYVLTGFLLVWFLIQATVYFSGGEGIARYNDFFFDTHRIFAASDKFIIKDTYHMFLDVFILSALIAAVWYLVLKIRIRRTKNYPN
ncbi:MAG: hypothetical protein LBP62_00540 [Clostridiales bacterium]|jgi:hypothetical protein|nr:hypothetical protein [Clostridiales bacterium]